MGRKKVTMKDIAEELDISIVSVSKALAGKEGVGDDLRQEIIDKAAEMGYVMKVKSRDQEQEINIAVLISERFISDKSFYLRVYQKILMELSTRGYIGILEIVRADSEREGILPKIVTMDSVAQVIVVGQMESRFLEELVKTEKKIIFFDFEDEEFDVDSIVGDNVNGGYTLTRYLVKSGYRKIGFVGNYKATRSILDRFVGYLKYLMAKDQLIDDKWTIMDRDREGNHIPLKLPRSMPEAFVCNCDETASRLIVTLKKAGYRVPEDVAVVGYDDYVDVAPEGVRLTTYHVNTDEMVRQCIRIVEQRVANPEYRHGTTVIYGNLVVGNTTPSQQ